MRFTILLTVILFLFSLLACEEPVDLGIAEEEPRLVVQCNFNPDSLFKVVVLKSRSALSNDPVEYIENAIVEISENGVFKERLPLSTDPSFPNPLYISQSLKPTPGAEYMIEVAAAGLETIRSENKVPPQVELRSFEVSNLMFRPASLPNFAIYSLTVSAEIDDPPELGNYYHLDFFYERVNYTLSGTDTIRIPAGFDFSLLLENTQNELPFLLHYDFGILISDEDAGGRPLKFTLDATSRPVSNRNELFDRIYVELRSVSRDYFLYHSSLTRQNQQTDSILAEPVLLYNNIENGYGIFAGYHALEDSMEVNQ